MYVVTGCVFAHAYTPLPHHTLTQYPRLAATVTRRKRERERTRMIKVWPNVQATTWSWIEAPTHVYMIHSLGYSRAQRCYVREYMLCLSTIVVLLVYVLKKRSTSQTVKPSYCRDLLK